MGPGGGLRSLMTSQFRCGEWAAWHWAHGRTQREIGAHLGGMSSAGVCQLIGGWLGERYPGKYIYRRLDAVRSHFAGVAEPALPEGARPFGEPEFSSGLGVGQRAIAAAALWGVDERAGRAPKAARFHYAERFGVGRTSVAYARDVLAHAPDLVPKVVAGELAIYEAAMLLNQRRPHDEYGRRLDRPPWLRWA